MSNIDLTHSNAMVAFSLGATACGVSPQATVGALHLRLMITNGTNNTYGTELPSGGGYVQGTGITPVAMSAPAAGLSANTANLTQTNMPSCTLVGGELWDSATTPARKWFGALTANKVINSGDTFTIPVSSLSVGVS